MNARVTFVAFIIIGLSLAIAAWPMPQQEELHYATVPTFPLTSN